jgi:hypothetical protein
MLLFFIPTPPQAVIEMQLFVMVSSTHVCPVYIPPHIAVNSSLESNNEGFLFEFEVIFVSRGRDDKRASSSDST